MKKIAVIAGVMMVFAGVRFAGAQEGIESGVVAEAPVVKKQTVCPVMGGTIVSNIFEDYDGKRVYFCCKGCPAEFKKDPAAYIAKMEKDGVTLDKTPVTAPAAVQTKSCDASATPKGGCCK